MLEVSQPTRHTELSLDEIDSYPTLAAAYRVWRSSIDAGGNGHLDPTEVPPKLLPTVMIVELAPDFSNAHVRLAGTYVCQLHNGELRGKSVNAFFKPDDTVLVLDAMRRCIEDGVPSLARRSYVSLEGDKWEYVRLLLPERSNEGPKRLFKAMEKCTLKRLPGPWPGA